MFGLNGSDDKNLKWNLNSLNKTNFIKYTEIIISGLNLIGVSCNVTQISFGNKKKTRLFFVADMITNMKVHTRLFVYLLWKMSYIFSTQKMSKSNEWKKSLNKKSKNQVWAIHQWTTMMKIYRPYNASV